jgi:hypothetical protein
MRRLAALLTLGLALLWGQAAFADPTCSVVGNVHTCIFTTAGSATWTLSTGGGATFNNANNTVWLIGGGANGSVGASGAGGIGGGGAAYNSVSNITLGSTAAYQVGLHNGTTSLTNVSYFNGTSLTAASVSARGSNSNAGGVTTNSIGSTPQAGGAAGSTAGGTARGGSGGGGSGGPGGAGVAGGTSAATTGGVGGNGAASTTNAGVGGQLGSATQVAGNGTEGTDITAAGAGAGSSGGGGGSGLSVNLTAGNGGPCGGGGGGAFFGGAAGTGGDGCIVVQWTAAAAAGNQNLLLMGVGASYAMGDALERDPLVYRPAVDALLPQKAWYHGYQPCPFGTSFADGCPGAPTNGSFQDPTFNATAAQNGQPSLLSAHPAGWNEPCVDYKCGYTVGTLVNASSASLPSGCAYASTGGGVNGTAPEVTCNGATNPTFLNIDFTNGGTACVVLMLRTTVGAITVNNFKMGNGFNCPGTSNNNGYLVDVVAPSPSVTSETFENGVIDGNPPGCTTCYTNPLVGDIQDGSTAAHTVQLGPYFVAINSPGRVINYNGNPGNLTMIDYYIHNWNMGFAVSGQHGEINQSPQTTNATGATMLMSYGETLAGNDEPIVTPPCGGGCSNSTTSFYLSTGQANNVTFSSVQVDHSIIVTNCVTTGGTCYAPNATAAWEVAYNIFSAATFIDDYIDPNGGRSCTATAGSPSGNGVTSPTFTSVIDLYDGSSLSNYDVTPCHGFAPQ